MSGELTGESDVVTRRVMKHHVTGLTVFPGVTSKGVENDVS